MPCFIDKVLSQLYIIGVDVVVTPADAFVLFGTSGEAGGF
jgi:hypothetical protein